MPAVRRFAPFLPAVALFLFTAIAASLTARAETPTTTVLTVTSSCLTQGCAVTLSAKVSAGTVSVHPGLVYFCEGSAAVCQNGNPVGTAQLTASGTATILHAFAPGTHSVYAVFHGTNTYSASTSSIRIVSIANTQIKMTGTSFNPVPVGVSQSIQGEYNFQATVTSRGTPPPTGTVEFLDTSFAPYGNNTVIGSANLGTATTGTLMHELDSFYLNQISSSVLSNIKYTAVGDVNNDGYPDIVVVGQTGLNVFSGNQSGSFTYDPQSALANVPLAPFVLLDVNSDGKLDAVFPDPTNNALRVALGVGNGTFSAPVKSTLSNTPAVLYPGDFNNDGIPDLAILLQVPNTSYPPAPYHAIQVALGNGDGTFTVKPTVYLSKKVTGESILIGDADGDGKIDLTVSDAGIYDNQFQVLHGNGDGTFTPLASTTRTFGEEFLVGGDFNSDGIPDIVSFDGALLSYWQGVGDGTFIQPDSDLNIPLGGGNQLTSLIVGDFNADGILDVSGVLDDTEDGAPLTFFLNFLGNTSDPAFFKFVPGQLDAPVPDTTGYTQEFGVLAIGDFNADGILDVVDFNPTGTVQATGYLGQAFTSVTTTSTAVTTLTPAEQHMVAAKYLGDTSHTASESLPQTLEGSEVVNESNGFADSTGLTLNGGVKIVAGAIQLTDGVSFEARSAFNSTRLPVYDFHSTFNFQIPSTNSDGLAFVIQSNGPDAIGSNGGGIGYGRLPGATSGASIVNSLALIFDTHNNQGEGANSVRVETGGITSPAGSVDLTPSGIDLHSGHRFAVDIVHAESQGSLILTLTDLTTGKVFNHTFTVDLFGAIGDTFGYVGFTSATGATASTVNILNWTYSGQHCCTTVGVTTGPYYPKGFFNPGSSIQTYNGSAIVGSALQLTNGTQYEATRSSFFPAADSQQWVTDFDFTVQGTGGDGFTFFRTSNAYPSVTGGTGGALGYAGPYKGGNPGAPAGFGDSLAIKFDLHNNAGEGPNSTGLYFNGAYPSTPAIDLYPSRIDLHSGHTFHSRISYFRGAINLSITDLTSYAVFTTKFPQSVGLGIASVGFTAATGSTSNTIKILNWTYDGVDVDF